MNTASQLGLSSLLIPSYRFEIKLAKDGQFYWVLHNTRGNVEPVAQSETYTTKQSCINSINLVKAQAPRAPIIDSTLSPVALAAGLNRLKS
jgi:uncharacterized protein YegP (UPF0339 family)